MRLYDSSKNWGLLKVSCELQFSGTSTWILGKPVDQMMVTGFLDCLNCHENCLSLLPRDINRTLHVQTRIPLYQAVLRPAVVSCSHWFKYSFSNLCPYAGLWIWHFNDTLFALLISALLDSVCRGWAEEKTSWHFTSSQEPPLTAVHCHILGNVTARNIRTSTPGIGWGRGRAWGL